MVIHVIIKVNFWLGFFSRKNRFLNIPLCRLLCNKIIQPFFDYACNACCLNVNKKLKTHEGLLETERHIQHKIQRFGKTKLASDSSKYIAMFSIQCVSIQCVYFFFTKNCRISMRYLFLYSYNSLLLSIFLIFFFFFTYFFSETCNYFLSCATVLGEICLPTYLLYETYFHFIELSKK